MQKLTLFLVIFLSVGCSDKTDNQFLLTIRLEYPFYPCEKFEISKQFDSINFEYSKIVVEIDSAYVINGTTYAKTIKKKDNDFFVVTTLKTDSLVPGWSDYKLIKDSLTNEITLNVPEKTKWQIVDSAIIPKTIVKINKSASQDELEALLRLFETMKMNYKSDTTPCLDGTTTYLNYRDNLENYELQKSCSFEDIKELKELIDMCYSIKERD